MDFSARQVLFLSSILILFSCNNQRIEKEIPANYKFKNDQKFEQDKGFLYYAQTPFSGFVIDLNETDDTLNFQPYYKGKLEGWTFEKYRNGKKKSKRYFENGKKEGIHTGWWENGQIKFKYSFKNDEYEGEVREWYLSGQLFKVFHYQKGHEFGKQKMWKSDGRIKANYEIKNGRRYGLAGVKNCDNVWSEVDSVLRSFADTNKLQ